MKRFAKQFLVLFIIFYALAVFFAFLYQRNMMYFPPAGLPPLSVAVEKGYEVTEAKTEDGLTIRGLYRTPPNPRGAVLVFHGNGSDVLRETFRTDLFHSFGLAVLFAEYRGYSHNEGRPTEAGLIKDAKAQYALLLQKGFPAENIYLYGHSLGTAVSLALAAENKVAGIMLETPLLSAISLAQQYVVWMPDFLVSLILMDKYRSDLRIKKTNAPLLFLVAGNDNIVPNSSTDALYDLAGANKEKVFYPQANHIQIWDYDVKTPIGNFLNRAQP